MATVNWAKDMGEAVNKAHNFNKPIFVDFFNPGWIGCQQMDAVTYPKQNVIEELDKHVVPVRIAFDNPFADAYMVKWTPNLVFLDKDRQVHHRIIGFLPAEELIPAILLGAGKTHFEMDDVDRAMGLFNEVTETHPRCFAAPQAVYFRGVCRYKKTHEADPLKEAQETLQAKYPDSEWTQRAAPYRLL